MILTKASSPLQRKRKCKPKNGTLPNTGEANLYAQKLNNSAAFCIEVGQYNRAIGSLTKALKLLKLTSNENHHQIDDHSVYSYTINECISYSETIPSCVRKCRASPDRRKKQRIDDDSSSSNHHAFFQSHFWRIGDNHNEGDSQASGSIYCRPIQIPCQAIAHDHTMGSMLYPIIVFNLALAQHQSALFSTDCSDKRRQDKLQSALKLYEHADARHHALTLRPCTNEPSSSQRQPQDPFKVSNRLDQFDMILCNNSSHIYRSLNKHERHQDSLQRLTSALMMVVDQRSSVGTTSHNDENSRNNHHEEFLQTASQLILTKQCADAA